MMNFPESLATAPGHAYTVPRAGVAELVDAPDSKSGFLGSAGSIPAPGTTSRKSPRMNPAMKFCPSCGGDITYRVPDGDNRERAVCNECNTIHYKNPLIVVGCIVEHDGKLLLCKRSIEPRYGYLTIPAGFMELGESTAEGAARETREEALAEVKMGRLFASVDVVRVGQLHLYYLATLDGDFGAGAETLETRLFSEDEIPWDDIAFHSGKYALRKYFEDAGCDNGVHVHAIYPE